MALTTTVRPGKLVLLRTYVRGGRQHETHELEAPDVAEIGPHARATRKEVTTIYEDEEELLRAESVRSAAGRRISAVCVRTDFGLLCPASNGNKLHERIAESEEQVREANTGFTKHRVIVHCVVGDMADNDTSALRAIADELNQTFAQMREAIGKADVDEIRKAIGRARQLGSMLDATGRQVVTQALDEAREAARKIKRRMERLGQSAEQAIENLETTALATAQHAFIDLAEGRAVAGPSVALPGIDLAGIAEVALDVADDAALPVPEAEQMGLNFGDDNPLPAPAAEPPQSPPEV